MLTTGVVAQARPLRPARRQIRRAGRTAIDPPFMLTQPPGPIETAAFAPLDRAASRRGDEHRTDDELSSGDHPGGVDDGVSANRAVAHDERTQRPAT